MAPPQSPWSEGGGAGWPIETATSPPFWPNEPAPLAPTTEHDRFGQFTAPPQASPQWGRPLPTATGLDTGQATPTVDSLAMPTFALPYP